MLPETNIGTLVVSIVAIVGLIIAKELSALVARKLPVPIPVELIAVSTIHTHSSASCLSTSPVLYVCEVCNKLDAQNDLYTERSFNLFEFDLGKMSNWSGSV